MPLRFWRVIVNILVLVANHGLYYRNSRSVMGRSTNLINGPRGFNLTPRSQQGKKDKRLVEVRSGTYLLCDIA